MKIDGKHYLTIWHDNNENNVHIIDQTKLPFKFEIKKLESFQDGYNAIKDMLVRGAPLIGATAAYSLYLASKQNEDLDFIKNKVDEIKTARPTAVNLSWAADRVFKIIDKEVQIKNNEIMHNFICINFIFLKHYYFTFSSSTGFFSHQNHTVLLQLISIKRWIIS